MGLLALIPGWGKALAIALIVAALWGHGYFKGKAVVQERFDLFVAQVKVEGEKAKLENAIKEKGYADKITVALTDRDAALNKLRQSTYPGRRASSENPAAPAGSPTVCYAAPAFDAAFRQFGASLDRFIQDARGVVTEGDSASIDAQALITAWPK